MRNDRDEKRSSRRTWVDIPVECCRLTADPYGVVYPGRIESCSRDGLCVELSREFAVGTVLVVRAVRRLDHGQDRPEVRCMAVAEVRWSQQRNAPAEACYGIGLKYLML